MKPSLRLFLSTALALAAVVGGALAVRALTFTAQTWDFPNNLSQYQISDGNKLQLTTAGTPAVTVAQLKPTPYFHGESTQAAFNGTMSNVAWDPDLAVVRMTASTGAVAELSVASVPGAVGLWHLNSTLNDAAGVDNTLIAPASPADPAASATGGKWGTGAYQFTAAQGDYLSTPSQSELEPTTQVTVETWVKFTLLTGQQGLVAKYANGSGTLKPAYVLLKTSDTDPTNPNRFQFLVGNTTTTLTVTGTTVITPNIWYHVAGTYDGTKATLYVNGIQDASQVSGALTLAYSYTSTSPAAFPIQAINTGWTAQYSAVAGAIGGYQFTPQSNGLVSQLCQRGGTNPGPRNIYLTCSSASCAGNATTYSVGAIMANVTNVSTWNAWGCYAISPVVVQAGTSYIVSASTDGGYYIAALNLTLPVNSGGINITASRAAFGTTAPPPANDYGSTVYLADVGFQVVTVDDGSLYLGRFATTAGGPYASLDGYLDEVLVSNQVLPATIIRAHGSLTYPITGGTYTSQVFDSTVNTIPVNRWRSLIWGEGPVQNLGDELTPNAMAIRPDDLWHFNEGTGQTAANAAVPPATTTPLQVLNPTPSIYPTASWDTLGGYSFTPAATRQVVKLGGFWSSAPLSGTMTRRVWLYLESTGAKLAYADITPNDAWAYAGMKDPVTNADLPSVTLTGGVKYVVAVRTYAGGTTRPGYASFTTPVQAGGVTIHEGRFSNGPGPTDTMPSAATANLSLIFGLADVQFATAGGASADAVLGSSSAVEAIDPAWTAAGRFDKALAFTIASNARAAMTPTNVTATDNWTFEAWVNYDGTTGPALGSAVVFNGNSGATSGYGLWRGSVSTPGANEISVRYGSSLNLIMSTGVPYDVGAWNHIAVVRRAGVLEVYKNGVRIGPDTAPADGVVDDLDANLTPIAPAAGDAITFGNLGNGSAAFGGTIDEAAFYTSALPASTILSDYRQGALRLTLQMRTGPTPTPDASWTEWRPANFLPSMAAPLPIAPDRFGLTALWHANVPMAFGFWDTTGGTNGVQNTSSVPGSATGHQPTMGTGQTGFGSAVLFDGNDYIVVWGNTPEINSLTNAVALECWVKPSAVTGGTMVIATRLGSFTLSITNGVPAFSSGGLTAAAAAALSPALGWHHLMGTYDTGRVALYVDGTLAGSSTGAVATVSSTNDVYLGAADNAGSSGFQGLLDEIALYNRIPSDAPFAKAVQTLGYNPGLQGIVDNNTYAQVRADLLSFDNTLTPQLSSFTAGANTYPTDKPWIRNLAAGLAPAYNALQTFTETAGPLSGGVPATTGTISYQITNDATGTTWYYFNGTAWVTAATSAQANPASVVNANLSLFPAQVGMGQLFWKAYFSSNGDQQVVLDALSTQVATGSVSLTVPSATWYLGTSGNIVAWSAPGISNVKLEYAPSGTGAFTTVTASTPAGGAGTGSYDWAIPQDFALVSAAGAGRFRITATDQYGTHITDTKSGYTVSAPSFTITMPGTQFPVQTTQRITWTTVGAPIGNSLKLEYVKGGASGSATLIANIQNGLNNCTVTPPPSGGCYDWFVPNAAVGTQVRLRLTDNGQPLTTGDSADFKVTGSLTVAAPAAATVWTVGQPHLIQWVTKGGINNVIVKYAKDGATFAVISGGAIANTGSFTWTTSTAADASAAGVLRVEDAGDATVYGNSPAFILSAVAWDPGITVASRWLAGSNQSLNWTQVGLTNVHLEYATGGAYADIIASVSATGPYSWTIPLTAVKRNGVTLRISDADHPGTEFQAVAVTPAFTVYGALAFTQPTVTEPTNFTCTAGTGAPCALTWTTTGSVPQVDLAYTLDGNTYVPIAAGTANAGSYAWVPNVTAPFIKVRVRDSQDAQTESVSGSFTVDGIGISAPVGGPTWDVGTTQTIAWSKTGSFQYVDLAYTTDGTNWITIIMHRLTNDTDSLSWLVPDAISTSAKVRVSQNGNPVLAAVSDPFSIRGVLQVTAPNGGGVPLKVGEGTTITWNATGTMPKIRLDLGTAGANFASPISIATLTNAVTGPNTYAWTVPDAITAQARVRVSDNDPAHPAASDASDSNFIIQAAFAITDPPASTANGWGVFEIKPIQWSTSGTVGRVTVEYTTDGTTWAPAMDQVGTPATNILNLGSFVWKVPDVVSPAVIAAGKTPGDGSVSHKVPTVQVRVRDVDAAHAAAARGQQSTAAFTVKWFRVKWVVKNGDTGFEIGELNVTENNSPPVPSWIVDNLTCAAGFTPCLNSPVYRHYPYGSYVTKWLKKDFNPNTITGWTAVRDASAGQAGADEWDKVNPVPLTSAIPDPTVYNVRIEPVYDRGTDTMSFKTWLEKQGQLPADSTLFGPASIDIYEPDGVTLRQSLSANPPIDGATGLPRSDWQKNYSFTLSPTRLTPGTLYFAKATITYESKSRSSGGIANVLIPSNQAVTLADLQSNLSPIATDVSAIKTETVGPASTLQTIVSNQTAIRADVAAARTAVQADVAGVSGQVASVAGQAAALQGTANAIKGVTDQILPAVNAVGTKVDNVQVYLADPNAGLPKILANTDNLANQAKAARRGRLMNRDTSLDLGESARIQYRSEGGALGLIVYNQAGAPLAGIPPLVENIATGLFEATITLPATGEFRVVVTESASANSDGTVDSVTLTVRAPRATAQAISNAQAALDGLTTQITAIEGSVNSLLVTAATIKTTTDATKTQADSIKADAQALLAKWGALDAPALKAGLDSLAAMLGTPPAGSSIAAELAAVRTKTDTIDWANVNALMNEIGTGNIAAIKTKTGTINWNDVTGLVNTAGTIQTKTDSINWADVAAVKTKTDTINWAEVTGIKTKTDTINWANVTALGTAVAQVQTDMAKDATVAKEASVQTTLATIQTSLTNLAATVNDPAQRTALDQALTLLNDIRTNMPVGGTDLTNINTNIATLLSEVGAGNIAAIKTKTDTINWNDVTGLVTTSGAIQAKTDTINWADVAAVKTKTDTVNWTDVTGIKVKTDTIDWADVTTKLEAIQTALNSVPTGHVDMTTVTDQLKSVQDTVQSLRNEQLETGTLMAKLDGMDKAVQSAAGASAAVGLSQSAFAAASEAVTLLQQLQQEVKQNGPASTRAPLLLGKFGDKMGDVAKAVTVIPGELDTAAVSKQLAQLTQGIKALASEKGYHFDSLYQMSEEQTGDVKSIRNHVQELRALVEIQKSILENKLNEPVVKTWFETGY